jgi:hypothetical protein
MLSPQAIIKGLVSRALPSLNLDGFNNDVAFRQGSYGEMYSQPLVRKAHNLADEGSYFTLNNGQSGITPPLGNAFSATAPSLVIYNNDAALRRLYLDYIAIANIVAVTGTTITAGSPCPAALVIDNGNRYSSGGTSLTLQNVNMAGAASPPNLTAFYGAVTATAPTAAARTVVGYRNWRPAASATNFTIVGDQFYFNFGAVEQTNANSLTIANASLVPIPMPAVVIGPGQSLLLYQWFGAFTPAGGASGMVPEVGLWMR